MKRLLDMIFAVVAIVLAVLFVLAFMNFASLLVPIDEGGEVSRLATAGIMRGLA
jgi:lipopolysaccharide/colanic/teichoic acid biosynthesis glycosyltransferase